MKKKILFWGIFCAFRFLGYTQEPLQCQDAVIALDENGEAMITSSDVLIHTNGKLFAATRESGNVVEYNYSLINNTIEIVDSDLLCEAILYNSYDRNPTTKTRYITGEVFDLLPYLAPIGPSDVFCDLNEAILGFSNGSFIFAPLYFTFDNTGTLYAYLNFSDNLINIFDPHSNLITPFANVQFNLFNTGITYDFDNHRILITNGTVSDQNLISIDLETQEVNTLFSFNVPENCNAKAIEYIGDNILIISGTFGNDCSSFHSLNIETQEITTVSNTNSNQTFSDFLFIEDEVENAFLNITTFTCDNLGENTIEVTQLIDGNPVTCEVTVTILSTFEFTNCPIYRQLAIDPDTGMGIIPNLNQNINLISSCSSDFTITQDISSGTLVDAGENIVVTLTATDELGQTAQCFVTVSTDPILNTDDIVLDKNITLFPNPTKGNITLQNENNLPLSEVIIYNSIGQIVYTQQIDNTTTDMRISLENYPDGIYFVRINSGNTSVVKRIIKQ